MPSGDTFDFINQPILPNTYNRPNQLDPQRTYQQQAPQVKQQPTYVSQPVNNEPEISVGGFSFTTIKDDDTSNKMVINVDNNPQDVGLKSSKKKRSSKKSGSTEVTTTNGSGIIRADDNTNVEVLDSPTINSYFETASMIKNAMDQIDQVASEIKAELDNVRQSRTMKSKYNVMVGLAGNISDLLEAKVSAIKELNNCISKSNELDYRREKDRRDQAADSGGDDKAIMDMYRAIVNAPQFIGNDSSNLNNAAPMQVPVSNGSGIIRAGDSGSANTDPGYINYMANMSPEMANMLYEQNPDIKQCVVFDASTGAKWFQVMNVKTNQPIPGAPVHDQMFMEDTVLDLKNRVAKNNNINETYPLIVINDHVTAEY
jgi:hypothetical protein